MDEMKDSGIEWIGKIPKDWNVIRCKYISTFLNGYAFDSKDLQMDFMYPVIRIGNIKNGGIDTINCQGVNNNYNIKDYLIKENDILLAMSGATVGKVGIAHNIENAYINQRVGIIRTDYPSYLFYCLSTKEFVEYILLSASGSAQPNVSADVYSEFSIPLPPKEIKIKIAAFLDEKCAEIDTLRSDIEKQIETLEEYKKSIITEAVTKGLNPDVEMTDSENVYWKDIPSNWKLSDIKYLFEIVKRIAGKEGYDILSVTQKGLKIKDISRNEGQIAESYANYQFVYPTDFVMNHMDLLTGWVDCSKYFGVTSPDYRVFRLKDKRNNLNYYKYIMQCCYMDKIFYSLGQGVSNLGRWRLQTESFNNFQIPVPPTKEQEQIAKYLDEKCIEIENIILDKQQQLEILEQYKKSLIYEYVTGKKEVPDNE
ncbi:putative uncharacterized protein [Eubacterium sp. CAG:38]|nr:putative uncharacterized protein [Eubacterium sp. CAG:38]